METTCPACGAPARRETDVSDTFLDSGWYFLRYPATDLENIPFPMKNTGVQRFKGTVQDEVGSAEKRTTWLPVNQYTGGAEHSVLHLLYSRFLTKVFQDLGYVEFSEPFPKFFAHGLIIKEGAKMSKSKGNVVVPDEYIRKYGADTLRTYLMFLGPFSDGGDFQDTGIEGIFRFMKRVWHLFTTKEIVGTVDDVSANPDSIGAKAAMHTAIKGVTEDISKFRYNTAIAKIMTWYNKLSDRDSISREEVEVFLKLLAPFAPHMTEELYQRIMNHESRIMDSSFNSIHRSEWPEYDESLLVSDTVTIAVQVNGKLRETLRIRSEQAQDQAIIEQLVKQSDKVKQFIEGKEIKKVVFVPGKVLNLVVL
jgi:leucyl-tRNA synthetase